MILLLQLPIPVEPSTLSSLPKDLAILLVFGGLVIALIKTLSPLTMIIKEQHESRLTRLEGQQDLMERTLSDISVNQKDHGNKLDTLLRKV